MDDNLKIVITKGELGFMVYDDNLKNRIDVFPDTDEGYKRMLEFLKGELRKQPPKPKQKLKVIK